MSEVCTDINMYSRSQRTEGQGPSAGSGVPRVIDGLRPEGTHRYYEDHADAYARMTFGVSMEECLQQFSSCVRPGGTILDIGSGSGRDSLWLFRHGYQVQALEASPRLADITSLNSGVHATVGLVEELDAADAYDGIWACAVLVHVHEYRQLATWQRLAHALRRDGVIYASYRSGRGHSVGADGRSYCDLDLQAVGELAQAAGLRVGAAWMTECALGRPVQWVNVLAQRVDH